jgi:hypothetical protein
VVKQPQAVEKKKAIVEVKRRLVIGEDHIVFRAMWTVDFFILYMSQVWLR